MNGTSRVTIGWPALVAGALTLMAAGAGIAYVAMRQGPATGIPNNASAVPVSSGVASGTPAAAPAPGPEVIVTLTPEAVQRAGLVLAPVTAGGNGVGLRLPGVVEAN